MRIFNNFDEDLVYEYGEKPKLEHQKHYNLSIILAFISFGTFITVIGTLLSGKSSDVTIYAVIAFVCLLIFILMCLTYQKWGKVLINAKAHREYVKKHFSVEVRDDLSFVIKQDKQKDIIIYRVKTINQDNNLGALAISGDIRQGNEQVGGCYIPVTLLNIKELVAYLKFSLGQNKIVNISNNTLSEILELPNEQREELLYDELAQDHFLLCVSLKKCNGISVRNNEGIELYAYVNDGYLESYADISEIPSEVSNNYPILMACTLSSVSQICDAMDSSVFQDEIKMLGLKINVDGKTLKLTNEIINSLVN